MTEMATHYTKFLAFLKLFYPNLYQELSTYSKPTEVVEANLICTNSIHNFQAMIFSEDVAIKDELFDIYAGKDSIAPYSWDWRWVFAVKIIFEGATIFPIKFKQKIIALPTGKHPLSYAFFDILEDEFKEVSKQLINNDASLSTGDRYEKYFSKTNF